MLGFATVFFVGSLVVLWTVVCVIELLDFGLSRCVSVRFLLIPEFVLCLLCTGRPNRQAKSRNYEAQTREKTIESGGVCFCCVVFVVFFVLCCSLNAVGFVT